MREITFRGVNKNTGEWEYGYYGKLDTMKEERHYIIKSTVTFNPTVSSYFTDLEVRVETIGEFTGLKDKNGIDIFEGDIIRSDKDSPIGTVVTAKVYWKGAGFALLTTRGSDTTSAYLELLNPFCEIIGNIYENPELMEASE